MRAKVDTLKRQVKEEKQIHYNMDAMKIFFIKTGIVIAFALVLFNFLIGIVIVSGNSMLPTIQSKEVIVYNRLVSEYKHGDIIVIKDEKKNINYIKRIIAMQYDEIDMDESGTVYLNQTQIHEPYIGASLTMTNHGLFPQIIGKNQVFVMGDNRAISKDSRHQDIGMIDNKNIKGRIIFSCKFY